MTSERPCFARRFQPYAHSVNDPPKNLYGDVRPGTPFRRPQIHILRFQSKPGWPRTRGSTADTAPHNQAKQNDRKRFPLQIQRAHVVWIPPPDQPSSSKKFSSHHANQSTAALPPTRIMKRCALRSPIKDFTIVAALESPYRRAHSAATGETSAFLRSR